MWLLYLIIAVSARRAIIQFLRQRVVLFLLLPFPSSRDTIPAILHACSALAKHVQNGLAIIRHELAERLAQYVLCVVYSREIMARIYCALITEFSAPCFCYYCDS
ncbi:hypothetical protein F5Y03DRAFT_96553 [Xylaria venustula]|nr:hypothetical protein F5Y03DRAFT_96553 [Xylaria venustula]